MRKHPSSFTCKHCETLNNKTKPGDNRRSFCDWYCSDDWRIHKKRTRKGKPPVKTVCVACGCDVFSGGTAGLPRQLCEKDASTMRVISRQNAYKRRIGKPATPKQKGGAGLSPERIAYIRACLGYL